MGRETIRWSRSKRLSENSRNGPTPDVPIQDIFSLYRRTKTLMGMYQAFCPKSVLADIWPFSASDTFGSGDAEFDIGGFFEPYVLQWLVDTDNKTTQWVQAVRIRLKMCLSLD